MRLGVLIMMLIIGCQLGLDPFKGDGLVQRLVQRLVQQMSSSRSCPYGSEASADFEWSSDLDRRILENIKNRCSRMFSPRTKTMSDGVASVRDFVRFCKTSWDIRALLQGAENRSASSEQLLAKGG